MPDRRLTGSTTNSSLINTGYVELPRPMDASYFSTRAEQEKETSESLLMEYYRVLVRRRRTIALIGMVGALVGLGSTLGVLPVYQARTSLDIQSLNADFMGMREVAQTGQGESTSSESYIATQIKLLQSDTLRARTVNKLAQNGTVTPLLRGDELSNIQRKLHLSDAQPLSAKEVLDYAAKNVKIKALGVTRLVEVTCGSWNPTFSAEFCNTLTHEFAEQDREVRWNEAQKTSEWLSRQLADLRASLSLSERKLEGAASNDALLLSPGNESVADQKLRELQSELMRAQADRVAKQAQYTISVTAAPEAIPVTDNGPLKESEAKLEDLRRQLSALVPPLTMENPRVQHIVAQIKELERSVAANRTNVVDRMKNEFDASQKRESLLSAAYAAQERRVSEELGKQAQVNMLRREVESGQQLYQTLLQRVKEAGFASAMQASTIRVVDAAVAPKFAVTPRKGASALVGFLVGIFFGIGFSFFRERTQTLLRVPGETTRYLHLRELGVIPSAKRGLQTAYGANRLSNPTASALPQLTAAADSGSPKSEKVLDMAVWQDQASLVAEAYRTTTYSILLAGKHIEGSKAYVVSSPNVGDGKTTVVCNLGLALAQANKRVLLIDGDVRKPRLHKAMRVENKIGLRDWLRGDLDFEAVLASICQTTAVPNLSILTSGTGSDEPTGLLHSPRLELLLNRLESDFDIILIDSPPMLHMADARILAGKAKGVILVFRARTTDRETALTARDLFLHDRVPVIGTILNDFDPTKEGKSDHFKNYYAYQNQTAEAPEVSKTA